ncbi:hypothetical protein J1614_003825 [Plenodomus biglobosus]|nr:hypothetical protein J1614_003825 [Plenodomus biglobosus]
MQVRIRAWMPELAPGHVSLLYWASKLQEGIITDGRQHQLTMRATPLFLERRSANQKIHRAGKGKLTRVDNIAAPTLQAAVAAAAAAAAAVTAAKATATEDIRFDLHTKVLT